MDRWKKSEVLAVTMGGGNVAFQEFCSHFSMLDPNRWRDKYDSQVGRLYVAALQSRVDKEMEKHFKGINLIASLTLQGDVRLLARAVEWFIEALCEGQATLPSDKHLWLILARYASIQRMEWGLPARVQRTLMAFFIAIKRMHVPFDKHLRFQMRRALICSYFPWIPWFERQEDAIRRNTNSKKK